MIAVKGFGSKVPSALRVARLAPVPGIVEKAATSYRGCSSNVFRLGPELRHLSSPFLGDVLMQSCASRAVQGACKT